jgi:hypothetical protein
MTALDVRNAVVRALRRDDGRPNANSIELAKLLNRIAVELPTKAREDGRNVNDAVIDQVYEVIHRFMLCGILTPFYGNNKLGDGQNVTDHNWCNEVRDARENVLVKLTHYGKAVIAADESVPYDPDGYLALIASRAPGLLENEMQYLQESIAAFHARLHRACLVMLGCASESLILRTIEASVGRLSTSDALNRMLVGNKPISSIFGKWRTRLESEWKTIAPEGTRKDEILRSIDNTFEIIRRCRNESAHPVLVETSELEMQVLLCAFGRYAADLLSLIG